MGIRQHQHLRRIRYPRIGAHLLTEGCQQVIPDAHVIVPLFGDGHDDPHALHSTPSLSRSRCTSREMLYTFFPLVSMMPAAAAR